MPQLIQPNLSFVLYVENLNRKLQINAQSVVINSSKLHHNRLARFRLRPMEHVIMNLNIAVCEFVLLKCQYEGYFRSLIAPSISII